MIIVLSVIVKILLAEFALTDIYKVTMSQDVKELFPGCQEKESSYFSHPGYHELVTHFGTVVVSGDTGYYQGDSHYILTDGERYGYLSFGWGSCSGCDALQGCSNYEDLQSLFDSLERSVFWVNTLDEFKKWFLLKDWETEYSYREEGFKEFLMKASEELGVEHLRALK